MLRTARLFRRCATSDPYACGPVEYVLIDWRNGWPDEPWDPEDLRTSDACDVSRRLEEVQLGLFHVTGRHVVLTPLVRGPVWLLDTVVRNTLREAGCDGPVKIESLGPELAKCEQAAFEAYRRAAS